MSNLQTLRSLLKKRLRVDQPGRIWDDAILNTNLNEALSNIQQDGSFDWFFNDGMHSVPSVVAQGQYALPTDFARLELAGVKYDTYMLRKLDYRTVFDNYDLTTQGTPGIYYLRGTVFGINPLPSSIKTIAFLYRKLLPRMTTDTSDSGMPEEFDEAIINYARYLSWADLQSNANNQMADRSKAMYDMTMQGLYAQYLGRRDEADFQWDFASINKTI